MVLLEYEAIRSRVWVDVVDLSIKYLERGSDTVFPILVPDYSTSFDAIYCIF